MKKPQRYTVKYRRKREGKTDYKARMRLLLSSHPRLVVRKSLKNVWAQLVTFDQKGDRIKSSAHGRELLKLGWKMSRKNLSASYLVGLLLAKKAKQAGISQANLDTGMLRSVKGNKIYAVVKGAKEGGLTIHVDNKMMPPAERISGKDAQAFLYT